MARLADEVRRREKVAEETRAAFEDAEREREAAKALAAKLVEENDALVARLNALAASGSESPSSSAAAAAATRDAPDDEASSATSEEEAESPPPGCATPAASPNSGGARRTSTPNSDAAVDRALNAALRPKQRRSAIGRLWGFLSGADRTPPYVPKTKPRTSPAEEGTEGASASAALP